MISKTIVGLSSKRLIEVTFTVSLLEQIRYEIGLRCVVECSDRKFEFIRELDNKGTGVSAYERLCLGNTLTLTIFVRSTAS